MIFDTNALSGWGDGFPEVDALADNGSRVVIPVVVLGEYEFGLKGASKRQQRELWLKKTLPGCEVHPITRQTAKYSDLPYAQIRGMDCISKRHLGGRMCV